MTYLGAIVFHFPLLLTLKYSVGWKKNQHFLLVYYPIPFCLHAEIVTAIFRNNQTFKFDNMHFQSMSQE